MGWQMTIRFGSVCSGIEAASVAFGPLGWQAAWFSEIEPFPCAVLQHHFPGVPNLGDMTTLPERIRSGEVEAPDMLCGGTPCQAFSVAGLRKSLDDERGNLSLVFCEIADAIDSIRSVRGLPPSIVFWENVPGVLNTKDNAFGCFMGELVGADSPLSSDSGRWPSAGVVTGPKRKVAWRVLDAQHFGVPQRRRRVFVVASARDGRIDPAKILFERKSLCGDSSPSSDTGQDFAARVGRSAEGASRTVRGGVTESHQPRLVSGKKVFPTLTSSDFQKQNGQDNEKYVVDVPVRTDGASYGLDRASYNQGKNAKYDFSVLKEQQPTLTAKGPGLVFKEDQSKYWDGGKVCGTLTARNAGGAQRMPDKDNFIAVLAPSPTHSAVRRLTPTEG